MAYDPADLRLPPWLLRLFDALVRVRLPIGPNWRLGLTRPGVMYALALLGIWAAAFYCTFQAVPLVWGSFSRFIAGGLTG